jgi:uncharacterized protein (DUF1697 family)
VLAKELADFDAVNIGAAGTFVIRQAVTQARLRTEIKSRLPFDAHIMICHGRDILQLMSQDYFADYPMRPDVVRFVSVLAKSPRQALSTPVNIPLDGKWRLKILARKNRFVFGIYRREMKAIGYLCEIDRLFGMPATTRNWNTITTIFRVLKAGTT